MAKKKDTKEVITRSQYFFKTLYHNPTTRTEVVFNKKIYAKDETLRNIEMKSVKINYVILLLLILMFIITSKYQQIWVVIAYLIIAVIGEGIRMFMLPKDIMNHIKDTGFEERH